MSHTKKIAQNTILQYISKILSTILGLVSIAFVTRYLGSTGFGHYSTIMGYLVIFATISDLGLTLTLPQMLGNSQWDDKTIISNIFTMRILSISVFLIVACIIIFLLPYDPIVKTGTVVTTLSFFFMAVAPAFVGYYQKTLKMIYPALGEVFNRVVLIIGIFLTIYFDWGIYGILIAVIFSNLTHFLIVYFPTRKFFRTTLAFDKIVWREAWQKTWPIALSITFNLLYLRLDTPILALFRDADEVGLYGSAYKVIDVLTSFPFIFAGLLLPLLSRFWQSENYERFKELVQHGFDSMSMLAFPIIVGVMFVANDAMEFIAGAEFRQAGSILKLLIWAQALIILNVVFAHAIVAFNAQKKTIWAYAVSAFVGIICYLVLIPKYGAIGAAITTLITEALVALLVFGLYLHYSKIKPSFKKWVPTIVSSGIMGAALWLLKDLHVLIQVFIGSVIYLSAMILTKGISISFIKELSQLRKS